MVFLRSVYSLPMVKNTHADIRMRKYACLVKGNKNKPERVKILYEYAYFLYAYPYFLRKYGRLVKTAQHSKAIDLYLQ